MKTLRRALIWARFMPGIVRAVWCLLFTKEGRVHLRTFRELVRK